MKHKSLIISIIINLILIGIVINSHNSLRNVKELLISEQNVSKSLQVQLSELSLSTHSSSSENLTVTKYERLNPDGTKESLSVSSKSHTNDNHSQLLSSNLNLSDSYLSQSKSTQIKYDIYHHHSLGLELIIDKDIIRDTKYLFSYSYSDRLIIDNLEWFAKAQWGTQGMGFGGSVGLILRF